ncbi:fused histidine kinase/response regulator receiver domain protein [Rivularia sp. PCC 7116]|uniref:hybrid sensor histidine kinase/response regulator n=1 Tax=Rivularia sp. PCC 7116 TaxID=373994 RepID=UPI00029F42C9|nr:ATP-binding protein [Rivularia sp. PCC 7116]AFY55222.1 fused histidine kinase/response regulator receiver domain protein [Rivularia sp. PCC 7116]
MTLDNNLKLSETDDDILFFEEEATDNITVNTSSEAVWKVLIVDDEPTVHQVTKLALKNLTFEGKPIIFYSGYSSQEGKKLIAENPDTALILLDVVMDSNDAGLQVVEYIRKELENKRVRIILRTGQPGDAPEESVITNYDINDYKLKVELTRQKLITSTIAALRSYRDILTIEEQAVQLSETLKTLQNTQLQLVQSEKMSALGNLVAGIAHEINNPIGFVAGNLKMAKEYVGDLFSLIDLYQQHYPNPQPEIESEIEAIDLEYLRDDLPKLFNSLKIGSERIRNISTSLRTFSRADTEHKIPFNIHEGIDSTILILQHRLKADESHPVIKVIKNYGDLPLIECYSGQLNQVFMNLLANAIDALEEYNVGKSFEEIEAHSNQIIITTTLTPDKTTAIIKIADNGLGIPEAVQQRIFENLFTTKAVGKGTGLGLSIAREIIVDKHKGNLTFNSEIGKGTEFVIQIPVKSVSSEQ